MVTKDLWDRAAPRAFQGVLADLRALWASRDDRHYKDLAAALGYTSHGKIVNLRTEGSRLRGDADAGDEEARLRIRRAEALAELLVADWWNEPGGCPPPSATRR